MEETLYTIEGRQYRVVSLYTVETGLKQAEMRFPQSCLTRHWKRWRGNYCVPLCRTVYRLTTSILRIFGFANGLNDSRGDTRRHWETVVRLLETETRKADQTKQNQLNVSVARKTQKKVKIG